MVEMFEGIIVITAGVTGPDEKPVGLVWFAWANKNGEVKTAKQISNGDRAAIREQAVVFTLEGIKKQSSVLDQLPWLVFIFYESLFKSVKLPFITLNLNITDRGLRTEDCFYHHKAPSLR